MIVAAAGIGSRLGMGSKALVHLNGRTTLARAVETFLSMPEIDGIVVVGDPAQLERTRAEVAGLPEAKPVRVCPGGTTRQQSVHTGLVALGRTFEGAAPDFVLVHDAARPLASPELVRRVLGEAVRTGAAFPGVPPRDAVKRVEGHRLVESLDRSQLLLAQTPQAFAYELLVRAHFQAADAGLVGDDDAQLVAAAGHPVSAVEGEVTNVKLTTPKDLELLEALIREQEAS